MSKRTLVITSVIVILGVGGFFGYRRMTAANAAAASATSLRTAQIESGTLVVSVNAAGTSSALQQIALTWEIPGTVGKINVAVGATVKAGEVLMELDPNSLDPSVLQAQADLLTAQAALETLLAGPTEQQIAQAQLAVVQAQDTITTTQKTLDSYRSPNVAYYQTQYDAAVAALTAAQQNAEINGYQTSVKNAADAVTNAKSNVDSILALDAQYPGYAAARDRLKNAQAAYDQAVINYQTALYKSQQTQTNDASNVNSAQNSLATAQANLAAVKAGPNQAKVTLAEAQLAVAKANYTQAQQSLQDLLAGATPQQIASAKAKIASAQATVNAMTLTAPFSGTVVSISNRVGDSVSKGAAAITLADLSALEVKVDVSEVDINRVTVGLPVNLTADAAPGLTFKGEVSDVSVVGKSTQGVVTFSVTVRVPQPDPALKPGMTAAVAIVTESHANVLMVPNRAIRTSAGQRTVSVLWEGQQIPVPVTIGLSNDSMSEILTGQLKEGDTVVLNSTTTTAQTQTGGGLFGLFGGGGGGGGARFGP